MNNIRNIRDGSRVESFTMKTYKNMLDKVKDMEKLGIPGTMMKDEIIHVLVTLCIKSTNSMHRDLIMEAWDTAKEND